MNLAPHDAELVEADARRLFEETEARRPSIRRRRWEDVSEAWREVFRAHAMNPFLEADEP